MNLKRFSMGAAFFLLILVSQFAPSMPASQAAAAARCNWVGFIADLTIPDGSTFKSGTGQGFIKTWRLKNIGACTWSTAYTLVFARGDQMSYLSSAPLPKEVKPGETIDLSVPMQAPFAAGHYRGYWQLKTANGALFGMGAYATDPFYVDIVVADNFTSVYDFAANVCAATWRSGAGLLPCPASDGDRRGFALKRDSYKMENSADYTLPGLLFSPENKYDGYIQGTYPEFTVQNGDRFQTTLGCEYGSYCYVTFRLDYQVDNGPLKIFGKWSEANDGRVYRVDQNLNPLVGKKVKFTLTLLAAGYPTGDRALMAMPFIVRTGGSGPTPTGTVTATATTGGPTFTPTQTGTVTPTLTASGPTSTPTATGTVTPTLTASATPIPPIFPDVFYDFGSNACAAAWKSGAGGLPCPGTDGDSRGFVLPVSNPMYENGASDSSPSLILFPQNKYDGYIQGTYPEMTIQAGDRFQSIVNCAYGSSCYVTFRLEYQVGNGPQIILWKWSEKNEGQFYRMDKDLSALAGQKVKFTLTLLASGPATGDRALWAQPRLIRPGLLSPTPTQTSTLEPPKVTTAGIDIAKPFSIACGFTNPIGVYGSISANGPVYVIYHWELGGDKSEVSPDFGLSFSGGGTIPLNAGSYNLDCGSYTAKLVVTSPNYYSAMIYFTVAQTNFLVSPTPTPTYFVSCTPPVCSNGTLTCGNPNGCPGGCGTICQPFTPTATVTVTPTATISPTPTVTATSTATQALIGPYMVILVSWNDVLNVRSGPGTSFGIVSTIAPTASNVWLTGAKSGDWVEVQIPGGTGWVNSYYLSETVSSAAFCADARVNTLLASLDAAIKSSNGAALAGLVNAKHGLDISMNIRNNSINFNKSAVSTLFTNSTSYDWGSAEGSGLESIGTFTEIMMPKLLDVFNSSYESACNDDIFPAGVGQAWPDKRINFYALKTPVIMPWRMFMAGIEYVDGTPYLFRLIHAQWAP